MSDSDERTFPMPAHSCLLVKVYDEDEVADSGIVLPQGTNDRRYPQKGTVMHVGPGYRLTSGGYAPMDWLIGDEVMFFKQNGVPVRLGQEELLLLRDEHILVVLDGPLTRPAGEEPDPGPIDLEHEWRGDR